MRRRHQFQHAMPHEFELDLAPLLAVMVKLVPVLLISSSFVQLMMVESDLPQAVKQAMVEQDKSNKKTVVQLEVSHKKGFTVIVDKDGKARAETIAFDISLLNEKLAQVKTQHPEVFRLEVLPDSDISYQEIVRIMDEARRSRNPELKFPVYDPKEQKQTETDYMFPDVVFANVIGG